MAPFFVHGVNYLSAFFTLVIPTCNRPDFLEVPVKNFLESGFADISLIVCDSSDTPEKVMTVLQPFIGDSRLTYIDNTVIKNGRPISMVENWNFALDHVKSEWVSVIGDDDVLDPSLVGLLRSLGQKHPNIKSARWTSVKGSTMATWNGSEINEPVRVSMGTGQYIANNATHLEQILKWKTFPRVPQKLAGLYHGAVKFSLLKQLRDQRGSWFKYANLDFEIGWLVSHASKETFFTERPFLINAASPKSNSWGVRRPEISKRNIENALGQGTVLDGWSEKFIQDFVSAGGDLHFFYMMPINVFGTTIRFHEEIGVQLKRETEINFAKILVFRSLSMDGKEAFDWYLRNVDLFFPLFFGKRVEYKRPEYVNASAKENVRYGLVDGELRIDRSKIPGNYEDMARLVLSLLAPIQ